MVRTIGLLCAALALSAGGMAHAALPDRVAVVYSEWSKSAFVNEYDKHLKQLGWGFDKYENVRLPELSGKLDGYNLVIATSVANYTKTVKMAPFAEAWRKWLADGGTLLVTDANYGSVLGNWVAAFGPGFESGCALCSAHTKPSDATRAATVRPDPLLSCPKPLGDLFQKHYRQWTHLTKLGPDWHTPISRQASARGGNRGHVVRTEPSGRHTGGTRLPSSPESRAGRCAQGDGDARRAERPRGSAALPWPG